MGTCNTSTATISHSFPIGILINGAFCGDVGLEDWHVRRSKITVCEGVLCDFEVFVNGLKDHQGR